ncbi:MAG: MBL fold metallo-hydrolase [Proteobacteria bacterium]|nr:MBL fold metallo-hydrolase [Pseudomonadota bacterium]
MDKLNHLKITILCENVVGNLAVVGEHGFAVYIETDSGSYLFDTGSGISILHNARVLKKDLSSVKKIFLSHGHYDHTGGLVHVLDVVNPINVYGHPAIFEEKFAISKEDLKTEKRFIGIPHRKPLLETKGANFIFNTDFQEIENGIYLTGEIPRLTEFEKGDGRLYVKKGDIFERDIIPDDQALIFSTKKGIVVLLGCAHAGIINTLWHIVRKMKKETFYAVIGGTHLGFVEEEQLNYTIDIIKQIDIQIIGVSHCTGLTVAYRLFKEFGDRFSYASVGSSFEI